MPRPPAVRGVLFAMLGLIMCEPSKAVLIETMAEQLEKLGVRRGEKRSRRRKADDEDGGDDSDDDESGLPNFDALLKDFKSNE